MSNPTTPFNWQMPTNTDLVTDLPADFEVFGQAVATSMADLLGGTSGQILSKNSNTDMDFVWINNDQGDITGITATSPLTGGGTSGAITVGIQASSTTQSGAVQLTDSTSSTSTTTAATPNSVKTSYDLAAAAIPKSTVTTAGDVIYATGSGAVTRLGIGTAGQVLTVNGGGTAPTWSSAAGGSSMTLLSTTTLSGTSTTVSSISGAYTDLRVVIYGVNVSSAGQYFKVDINGTSTSIWGNIYAPTSNGASQTYYSYNAGTLWLAYNNPMLNGNADNSFNFSIQNYANTSVRKAITTQSTFLGNSSARKFEDISAYWDSTSAVTSLVFSAGTFTAGTVLIYGVK